MKNEKKKKRPPEFAYTVFLDRTHGKAMATLLRKVNIPVRSIWQVFPRKRHEWTEDPDWISRCAKEGWVAISGDKRLLTEPRNKKAILDAKLRVFILTDTNSLPEEWAAAVIAGRTKIENVTKKNPGPFFAVIQKQSHSHVSHAQFFEQQVSSADHGIITEEVGAE